MKPIAIIAISVVCSVAAIGVIELLVYGVDIGESVGNIVPFDCAKAWDTMQSSLRITDNKAFQELSPEERREIRNFHGNILDEFHKNWCYLNHEEWQHRSEDKNGRLAYIDSGVERFVNWDDAIATEFEYNEKFPDGAYKD